MLSSSVVDHWYELVGNAFKFVCTDLIKLHWNCISGVMVSMLSSSVVDHWYELRWGMHSSSFVLI